MASIVYFADGDTSGNGAVVHCLVCDGRYMDYTQHICPGRETVVAANYAEAFRTRVLEAAEDDITLDSEWVFWPTWNRGHYTAAALRVLADELDRRNKELEEDDE